MHKIRKSLRGEGEVTGVVLMGKNTMVGSHVSDNTRTGLHSVLISFLDRMMLTAAGATSYQGVHCRLPRV